MPTAPLPVLALAALGLAILAGAGGPGTFAAFGLGALAVLALLRLWPEAPRPEPLRGEDPVPPGGTLPLGYGRVLIEKLPAPLLILSRSGLVVFANPSAQAALPRIAPGVHFANVMRAPAFVEAVTATLSDGTERSFLFTTHQGRERFFEARVGLLPPGGGFGPEAQAIVQIDDRTQTRRAEMLRSDFIANASHELRTPLASIIGYIETLQNHARDDAEARENFLAIMSREAARMQRLVDDLMSLSRIEMSEHLRPVEPWSLTAIAADSAAAFAPLAQQRGVTLDIDLVTDEAAILGDRDQLNQVFVNLIDNAVKYSGTGAEVRIASAEPSKAHPNRVGVTIYDTGPGIAREHIPRLTERFYRVNVANSRNSGGTGLGLAIVKHILNRHEGRLEIASSPGEGSAFTVWLPRAGPEHQAAATFQLRAQAHR